MQTNRQTIIIRQSPGKPADKIRDREGLEIWAGIGNVGPDSDSLHCLQQLQKLSTSMKGNKQILHFLCLGGSYEQQKRETKK